MELQVLLVIVIVLLTIVLVAVGIYLVLVLREIKETISKFNHILETTDSVVSSFSSPLISLSAIITAFTQGFKVMRTIKDLTNKEGENEQ